MIIHSGFNVYPSEIEAVLNQHPSVSQTAVVGRKREDGNEDIIAIVECAANLDTDDKSLKDYAAQKLAPYKRPKHILVVAKLPAAPSGKLLKSRMIETFSGLGYTHRSVAY